MPRRSCTAVTPDTPSAWSVMPARQARPSESLTITPTVTPSRCSNSLRSAAAEASGSAGNNAISSRATFDASTPAPAITTPCRLTTIRRSPRRATTRTVSSSMACWRTASRATGSSPPTATSRPSALETILDVTTTTSPSSSHVNSAASSAPRSSPGRTSPSPVTGMIRTDSSSRSVMSARLLTRRSRCRRAPSPRLRRRRSCTGAPGAPAPPAPARRPPRRPARRRGARRPVARRSARPPPAR